MYWNAITHVKSCFYLYFSDILSYSSNKWEANVIWNNCLAPTSSFIITAVHDNGYMAEIQNYVLPYGSLGPTDHDPYGSQSTGNGSHHWCLYSLEILRCVPRMQVISRWGVPFEFYWGYMTQDAAISESLDMGVNDLWQTFESMFGEPFRWRGSQKLGHFNVQRQLMTWWPWQESGLWQFGHLRRNLYAKKNNVNNPCRTREK